MGMISYRDILPRLLKIGYIGHTTQHLLERVNGWWITKSIKPFIVCIHPLLGYYHRIKIG